MDLTFVDLLVFVAFMAIGRRRLALRRSREKSSEDYFLAGRSLGWGLIGFSLIASNISTEHFVGMAGQAFGRVGLAIASYEWMSAIVLVFVAWWLLPRFLKAGIYTMPEYLEYRYDSAARTTMAVYMMAAYVIVFLATVLFSGAVALNAVFDITGMFEDRFGMAPADAEFWANVTGIWLIGIVAGCYTIYGGLKAVVWSDLLQGGGLLIGGAHRRVPRPEAAGRRKPARRLEQLPSGQRRQAPCRAAVERSGRAVVGGLRRRPVDSEHLLLGPQPVHHAAHARRQEPGRGAEGHLLRRRPEAAHPVHHRHARHHGVPALRRPDRQRRQGLSLHDQPAPAALPARRHVRGALRRGDELVQLGDQLGLDDLHDRSLQEVLQEDRLAERTRSSSAGSPRA